LTKFIPEWQRKKQISPELNKDDPGRSRGQ
jgi:hypothetical protein